MKKGIDIHGFDVRLSANERLLEKCNPISAHNSKLIKRFEDYCFSIGLSKARVSKYISTLRRIAEEMDVDLDKAKKEDIEGFMGWLERNNYSPWTKHDFKVALKRFYKWLRGTEDYPPEVKWIKTTLKAKDELLPEDLLTEDDVMKLVNAATNPRDKAFIMALYESGARIGELGSMRIRDVKFEEGYTTLMLNGKTGSRRVIVVASTPYIQTWIENHPFKEDLDAPLWINLGTLNRYEAMSYPALARILKSSAERAGLKKRIHPHKLRHSRATFLASKLTEAQMNQLFGWRQGSKMPSIYVHLSGRDIDDAILGVYGLKKAEEREPKLKPKVCPRCNTTNRFDARFCMKCGLALDVNAAMELEDARHRADSIMDVLMKDLEFKKLLMKKLKEHGIT